MIAGKAGDVWGIEPSTSALGTAQLVDRVVMYVRVGGLSPTGEQSMLRIFKGNLDKACTRLNGRLRLRLRRDRG